MTPTPPLEHLVLKLELFGTPDEAALCRAAQRVIEAVAYVQAVESYNEYDRKLNMGVAIALLLTEKAAYDAISRGEKE